MNGLSPKRFRWSLWFITVFTALSWSSATLFAKDGRDFAGFYDITSTTDSGTAMSVTVNVLIFNYSGGQITNAVVSLQDSLLLLEHYGNFGTMTAPDYESVVLSRGFSIPYEEYERWQQGGAPSVRVEYTNTEDQVIHCVVELIQQPFVLEEES